MQNVQLDETQAGIEIAGRNINNLKYAYETTLKPGFHSPLSPSSRGSLVPLYFLPQDGVICISEVVNISPDILDSTL